MTGREAVYVASISPRPTNRPSLSAPQQNRETARCLDGGDARLERRYMEPDGPPSRRDRPITDAFGSSVKWLFGPARPLIR
jgi:hypothetical protein